MGCPNTVVAIWLSHLKAVDLPHNLLYKKVQYCLAYHQTELMTIAVVLAKTDKSGVGRGNRTTCKKWIQFCKTATLVSKDKDKVRPIHQMLG